MFDSPENRFRYEYALTRHAELMKENSNEGASYRYGFNGQKHGALDDYEHWRAGEQNAENVNTAMEDQG